MNEERNRIRKPDTSHGCKKCSFIAPFLALCIYGQSRVEIEHYSVAYFDRVNVFKAL